MSEVVLVGAEQVMFPKGIDKPCTAHVPVGPFGLLVLFTHGVGHRPDVGVVRRAPSPVDAIVVFGGMLTVFRQCCYESVQWHGHLTEVGHFGEPIVLFKVDVHGIVAAPG